jgi:hypothetical protein
VVSVSKASAELDTQISRNVKKGKIIEIAKQTQSQRQLIKIDLLNPV